MVEIHKNTKLKKKTLKIFLTLAIKILMKNSIRNQKWENETKYCQISHCDVLLLHKHTRFINILKKTIIDKTDMSHMSLMLLFFFLFF